MVTLNSPGLTALVRDAIDTDSDYDLEASATFRSEDHPEHFELVKLVSYNDQEWYVLHLSDERKRLGVFTSEAPARSAYRGIIEKLERVYVEAETPSPE